MTLKQWITNNSITQDELADALSITQSQVSRIVNKGTTVLSVAVKIRDLTDGAVSVDDLLPKVAA